jgi:hypothetical protein
MLLCLSLFYSIDMVELLLPCGFNCLEYFWVKATIGICTLADYFVAKKRQQRPDRFSPVGWAGQLEPGWPFGLPCGLGH